MPQIYEACQWVQNANKRLKIPYWLNNEHHVFLFIKYLTDLYKCYTKSLLKICDRVLNMVFAAS